MRIEKGAAGRRLAPYVITRSNRRLGSLWRLFLCRLNDQGNDANEYKRILKQFRICNHVITPFRVGGKEAAPIKEGQPPTVTGKHRKENITAFDKRQARTISSGLCLCWKTHDLSLWERWHGKAVTERTNHRRYSNTAGKQPSQSPSVTAYGPGRNHRLLPALAKNMPPACFLNASRPQRGSFWAG